MKQGMQIRGLYLGTGRRCKGNRVFSRFLLRINWSFRKRGGTRFKLSKNRERKSNSWSFGQKIEILLFIFFFIFLYWRGIFEKSLRGTKIIKIVRSIKKYLIIFEHIFILFFKKIKFLNSMRILTLYWNFWWIGRKFSRKILIA